MEITQVWYICSPVFPKARGHGGCRNIFIEHCVHACVCVCVCVCVWICSREEVLRHAAVQSGSKQRGGFTPLSRCTYCKSTERKSFERKEMDHSLVPCSV